MSGRAMDANGAQWRDHEATMRLKAEEGSRSEAESLDGRGAAYGADAPARRSRALT